MNRNRQVCWSRTIAVGLACAVLSVGAEERLNPIVVTATRTEQPLTDVLADVTVIDREVIERNAGGSVADVLAKEAGVQIMRNGGVVAETSVYMRGADSRFTAVFIDGIRVDSQTTSGGVNWSALPLGLIDHIEILRGPAGAMYGSDAVAGVIQIFTRKGEAGFHPSLMVGRNTYQTDVYEAGVHGGNGQVDYSLGWANDKSRGFNVLRNFNPDADGYQRESAYGRFGLNVNADHRVELTWLNALNLNQYDGGTNATTKAKDWLAKRNLSSTGVTWQGKFSSQYKSQFSASQSVDLYETRSNGVASSYSQTTIHNYLWLNEWHIGVHQLSAALERREDSLNNQVSSVMSRERSQTGVGLAYGLRQDRHSLQVNLRNDRESQFGGQHTHSVGYAYGLGAGWRASVSSGTAFRAPTLYQRFHSTYGNPDLLPEFTRSKEVGLKYASGADAAGLTLYRNRIDNMISFDSATSKYQSTAQASLEGATLSGKTTLGRFDAHASWDVINPRDEISGLELKRRARHMSKIGVDTVLAQWRTGVDVQFFDRRFEDDKNTIRLGGYSLVNLYATRPIDKDVSLWLRVDNLTNRFYELAANYYPPGTTVFVGLRWSPS